MVNKKNDKNILELKEIDGIKFRIMWSSRILYLFLSMMIFLVITIQIGSLLKYGLLILDYDGLIFLVFTFVFILLILSYFNGKFLGKVVAVINENGIYTKDEYISWNKIKGVCYHTPIPLSRTMNKYEIYCSLTIFTDNNEYKILHAPHKMIRCIKKYIPDVKVKRDNELIFIIILCLCVAFLIPIADKFNLF